MSKVRVTIVLEFEDLELGSVDEERIVNEIVGECERIRVGFDANDCWVDEVIEVEETA